MVESTPAIDAARESGRITEFISRFVESRGVSGIALGLSGGLDSSVVAALCVRALGAKGVYALLLPERDSSPESVRDASALAEQLGIEYRVQDLTAALAELGCYESAASDVARLGGGTRAAVRMFPGLARKGYLANVTGGGGKHFHRFLAFHRIKHRLRMVSVYRAAEERNLVVASCANRTEHETGFFVRYGDDAGDCAPIKHLYKTHVFAVGRYLELPASILEKQPSPDLFSGMKDEEIMGITYETLDSILWGFSAGLGTEEITGRFGIDATSVEYVIEMKRLSERMREAPASLVSK
ncbi:MAG TPA: NAD(+) synthase [Patescibacteria group bacterium]|nr:NAD(+) synthase [Patescibacteria group bacterium]